jgi:hypothetical protein
MRIGKREVVQNTTLVTQFGDDTVEVEIADLTFRLIFQAAEAGAAKVRAEGSGKLLSLYLTNFDNPLGSTWFSEVGTRDDKKLFLALYISTIGSGEKVTRLIRVCTHIVH